MFKHPAARALSQHVLALALLGACRFAGATDVPFDERCTPQLSPHQQLLYDKASAGTDVLRDYLWSRRSSPQPLVYDVAVWTEDVNKRKLGCLDALAAHDAPRLASAQADPR